jgi:hypothetical protein
MTLPKLAVAQSGFGGRGYKNPVTGRAEIVPSITTVLKSENKPALVQWAVDQTAGWAVANANQLLTHSEDWGYKFLRWYHKRTPDIADPNVEIHNYHLGVRDDAADMGTAIHEWIQADIVPWLKFPNLDNQGDMFWQMVEQWEAFKKGKEIIPHYTERTVWSSLGYAGTFDGVWTIDGRYYLMDIKSSRGLYDSTWMQIAALFNAEEMFEPQDDDTYAAIWDWQKPVEGLGVLHIRPEDWDNKGRRMAPFCKWVDMPNPHEVYFKGFKGLLQYKHAMRELQVLDREREKNGS